MTTTYLDHHRHSLAELAVGQSGDPEWEMLLRRYGRLFADDPQAESAFAALIDGESVDRVEAVLRLYSLFVIGAD